MHTTDAVALIGFRTPGQIATATSDVSVPLTPDELALIRRTGQNIRGVLDAAFGVNLSPAHSQPGGTP